MQTKESLAKYEPMSRTELQEAHETAVRLVKENLSDFTKHFPHSNSQDNWYPKTENVEWTTGFWTGQVWLSYEACRDADCMHTGQIQVESFLGRIENQVDVAHHDMGFLYSPSCVAAYRLTGNKTAKKAALMAADQLMGRFQETGQFFQAWGELGVKEHYRLIIDCLLNMPLLFWASEVTGKECYRQKAEAHIKTAMKCVIRPDSSTYHTYYFDTETGEPLKGVTFQGNRDGSAWARGQAWGIYGAALSCGRLRDPEYIEIFKKVTDYFLLHLPDDLIPYWDFDFDSQSQEPRDSSSAAIAACGMLEMAAYLQEEEAQWYILAAKRLLKALWEHCGVRSHKESNGLLLHGTYARKSPDNPCENRGVDECNTWGDYFYLEALTRLKGTWNSYW